MKKQVVLAVAIALLGITAASAQTKNEVQALAMGNEAIRMMDEKNDYAGAIALLKKAQALDPASLDYPYEIAYAHMASKEYKKASDILETLKTHAKVNGRVYQALGNAYDYQGNTTKAIATYDEGLKKFPNAGELYLERGNMEAVKEKYNEALYYYEQGIKSAPTFPSNYYHAARIFLASQEEVWGMLYGEIFMNMERNSKRTEEMSKMLFNTYKSEIKFTSDTSMSVSFAQTATIDASKLKSGKNFKLPFGNLVYEPIMAAAVALEKKVDINSLHNIRKAFLELYTQQGRLKEYPNVVFDYQKKVADAGHLEAYNHWILMKGDEEGFENWYAANKAKFDKFVDWFGDNQMKISATNRFYRTQYD